MGGEKVISNLMIRNRSLSLKLIKILIYFETPILIFILNINISEIKYIKFPSYIVCYLETKCTI
jgi:hypothetical protein